MMMGHVMDVLKFLDGHIFIEKNGVTNTIPPVITGLTS
jgi:hypothetical protein